MKKQNLVFFDLDNTLLNIDSSYVFIRKYYNAYILFYSFLRKFRIIDKSIYYSKITKHCETVLVNDKLDIFVTELQKNTNDKILELALKEKSTFASVIIVSSSPHIYVSFFAKKLGFEGFGSYYDKNKNFIHLDGEKKYHLISDLFPNDKFFYKLGVSDNLSDLSFSDKFDTWIKV